MLYIQMYSISNICLSSNHNNDLDYVSPLTCMLRDLCQAMPWHDMPPVDVSEKRKPCTITGLVLYFEYTTYNICLISLLYKRMWACNWIIKLHNDYIQTVLGSNCSFVDSVFKFVLFPLLHFTWLISRSWVKYPNIFSALLAALPQFLPEAGFGLRVLSLHASVSLCVRPPVRLCVR